MDKSKDAHRLIAEDETLPPTVPMAPMKLPAFWPDAAEVWFAQADAQFGIKAMTVLKTKFYHAVAVLPQKVAAQILDLIRAPPARTPYEVLKDRLITLYSLNDYQRFKALVLGFPPSLWRPETLSSHEQMVISPILFSEDCSCVVFLQKSIPIFCKRRSPTLKLWL